MNDPEIITEDVERYLREIRIPLRLACLTPSGWPMVLSLWYLYRDKQLYCATQQSAKVVQYLRHRPECAFEISADQPPYCGVRGQALVTLDQTRGPEILQRLIVRYLGQSDLPLAQKLLARSENEVALVIKPSNIFTWNFSDRMKDSVESGPVRPCPE